MKILRIWSHWSSFALISIDIVFICAMSTQSRSNWSHHMSRNRMEVNWRLLLKCRLKWQSITFIPIGLISHLSSAESSKKDWMFAFQINVPGVSGIQGQWRRHCCHWKTNVESILIEVWQKVKSKKHQYCLR